ncbi:NfeD family protein [bacterium]|nr:NfeD family protein [bacterium]
MESLTVAPWIIWTVIAVASFILEIFIPGFWVAILGIGALAAVPLAALGAGTTWQILVFAVVSIIAGIFFRPLALKYFFKSSEKREANTYAMIGKKAKVLSKITADEPGKAKIGSEVWTAVPENEEAVFNEGETVEITAVDGAKIIVKSHN